MQRCYKKKRTIYNHYDAVRAMKMVNKSAETIYNAARTCGVPKETL